MFIIVILQKIIKEKSKNGIIMTDAEVHLLFKAICTTYSAKLEEIDKPL